MRQNNFQQKKYYFLLQLLRAYAAIFVVYEHLYASFLHFILHKDNIYCSIIKKIILNPLNIENTGALGVVQFFLLSGFVITMVAMRETRSEFAIKRFFRIFPSIVFSLIIITLLYKFLITIGMENYINRYTSHWPSFLSTKEFNLPNFIKNCLLIKVNLNPVLWTLRIEILFYFIVFLVMPYLKKAPIQTHFIILVLCCIMSLLKIVVTDNIIITKIYNQVQYLPYLFLGSLFYLYYSKKISRLFFILLSFLNYLLLVSNICIKYLFLSYLLLIISVYFDEKVLVPKFPLLLGKMSYSIYLNHQTTGTIFLGMLVDFFGYSNEKFLFFFLVICFFVFCISFISYKYIELPSQRFARELISFLKLKCNKF